MDPNNNFNQNDRNNNQNKAFESNLTGTQFSNDTNNLKNSNMTNNSKFKKITKKIFIILTIIISLIGCFLAFFTVFIFFFINSTNSFKDLFNLLGILFGIIYLFYTACTVGVIWLIYGIIILLYKLYKKLKVKHRIILSLILISLLILIVTIFVFINNNNRNSNFDNTKNLATILNNSPGSVYDTSSYYFIYNDKIYYYVLNTVNTFSDQLFVMNLDGTDKKKLAETDELRYASFYFVYNNEAYYYTPYYNDNKKINLSTGEITSLGDDDIYIGKTLRNGIINTFKDHPISGNSYSIFKTVDLNKNIIISEIKTEHSMSGNDYCFDYEGGHIYYLEDYYSDYPTIYKNTDVLYQFEDKTKKEIDFLAVNKDYLYFKSENLIYKLNINTQKIEKEISLTFDYIHIISSGDTINNYFYADENIYEFDLTNDQFNLILSDVKNKPEYVYNINNKLIFTENTDNLKRNTPGNNLGSVIIYNISSKNTEEFNNIRKVSFDENYMYLLISDNKNYTVQKYQLNS